MGAAVAGAPAALAPTGEVGELCVDLRELTQKLIAAATAAEALGIPNDVSAVVTSVLDAATAELHRLQALISDAQHSQIARLSGAAPLLVNLGSGPRLIDGWVNVDIGGGDVVADLRQPLPFDAESVAAIYASHVLEHLRHPDEAWALLAQCRRMLRRGGRLRLVVPDMAVYVAAYHEGDDADWAEIAEIRGWDQSGNRLDQLLRYGGAVHHPMNRFGHRHGFDRDSLIDLVASAGFGPIRLCGYQGSADPRLRIDDRSHRADACWGERPLSLFVEATKLF